MRAGNRSDWAVFAAGSVLVASFALWAIANPATLAPTVLEDGPFENASAVLYLLAAYLFARTATTHRSAGLVAMAPALALASAMFVFAGEEISWGQRLIGIVTPPAVAAANVQGELNLHNMKAIIALLGGQQAVTTPLCFGLGLLAPSMSRITAWREFVRHRHIHVPPWYLASLFLGSYAFGRTFHDHFRNLGYQRTTTPEVSEFLLALALWAYAFSSAYTSTTRSNAATDVPRRALATRSR